MSDETLTSPNFPHYLLIFLISSNAIYIIAAIILKISSHKLNIPLSHIIPDILELIILCFISSFHHACDNTIYSYCIGDSISLNWLDDFYSIWIITVTINVHLSPNLNMKYLYRTIMFSVTLILFLFQQDNTYSVILPISFCSLNVLFINRRNINGFILVLSGICIITARILKSFDGNKLLESGRTNMYNYVLFHSLWHVISGLSIICCILSIKSIHIPN